MRIEKGILAAGLVFVFATSASAQQSPWGDVLKSAAQAAGQAAVQKMSPQAQTVVTDANKLGTNAEKENFLLTKAKEFMSANNYQAAMDLANYVVVTINSKSVDAKKIMADAKTALTKMAQDKLAQSNSAAATTAKQSQAQAAAAQKAGADVTQAANSIKSLFGTSK